MKRIIIGILLAAAAAAVCGCTPFGGTKPQSSVPETTAQMSEDEPEAYDALRVGYMNLQTEEEREIYRMIDVYANKTSSEEFRVDGEEKNSLISTIFEIYDTDHPEVFWVGGDYDFQYYNISGQTAVTLYYSMEGDELEAAQAKFDAATESALKDAPFNGSDFEKELFLNDFITAHCEYDYDAADSDKIVGNEHNAYGALVEGSAVCEGYTKAFQHLANRIGLECSSINGVCEGNTAFAGNHIWNCVKLDGEWYHIDTTWNDYDEDDSISREVIRHAYVNLTTEEICRDHTINPYYYSDEAAEGGKTYNTFIPECTATKYNYFLYYYPTLTSFDEDGEIKDKLTEAAANRKDCFIVNVDKSLDFKETYQAVLDGYAYEWLSYANNRNDSDCQVEESCYIYTYGNSDIMAFALKYKQ